MKRQLAAALIASIVLGPAIPGWAQVPQAVPGNSIDLPHAWPRSGAEKILENDRGAMWNIDFAEGVGAHWHKHQFEFVGVELTTSAFTVTNPDGMTHTVASPRGKMWILPKGLTHMEKGLTTPGRNILIVDLKDGPSPGYENKSGEPSGYAGTQAKLVNDTARLLQWDVSLSPSVPEKATFHSRDIFICVLDGGRLKVSEPGKPPELLELKPGVGAFLKGGVVRSLEAVEATSRLMLVELK
ncbi:hypothetical protein [Bosea sp. 685]|uniref:hypothetical protein n=1 Tax=Bosea sp. 685 TaxID=3080057 RepID=UPI0028935173|nr:hypothetical protein [Bosea sp. 685]WNJ87894.1 hypothetical protein RMR04_00635 [Bosea sp. 685]